MLYLFGLMFAAGILNRIAGGGYGSWPVVRRLPPGVTYWAGLALAAIVVAVPGAWPWAPAYVAAGYIPWRGWWPHGRWQDIGTGVILTGRPPNAYERWIESWCHSKSSAYLAHQFFSWTPFILIMNAYRPGDVPLMIGSALAPIGQWMIYLLVWASEPRHGTEIEKSELLTGAMVGYLLWLMIYVPKI